MASSPSTTADAGMSQDDLLKLFWATSEELRDIPKLLSKASLPKQRAWHKKQGAIEWPLHK